MQGVTSKYADLTKGQLIYDGGTELPQYYIVNKKIIDIGPVQAQAEGNWEVQVFFQVYLGSFVFHIILDSFRFKLLLDAR